MTMGNSIVHVKYHTQLKKKSGRTRVGNSNSFYPKREVLRLEPLYYLFATILLLTRI